ncbi:hypothetical protein AWA2045_31340 (plasmid) [Lactiplantibacillus plantarum]|nr:hypothetical protein AWA2045_31340 [Lactiplantibacillus plantarum]
MVGKSFLSLGKLMLTNPIGLVVTAVVALGVALYEAYKHIKPFRDAVNGMGTAMKKLFTGKFGWEKSIGKKLAGVGSTISKWGKGAGKFVSKHKTEILAGLVSPFAGLSAWFLKDTKTGKNVQKWAKGFSKDIKKMGLKKRPWINKLTMRLRRLKSQNSASGLINIDSSFNSFKKSFKKTWNKHWSDTGKTLKRD